MSLEAIQAAIPHRDPFLLIDTVVAQDEKTIHCRKTFTGDEYFYRGHYPNFPLTPGVLLCEAGMQAGAVLLSKQAAAVAGKVPVATRHRLGPLQADGPPRRNDRHRSRTGREIGGRLLHEG